METLYMPQALSLVEAIQAATNPFFIMDYLVIRDKWLMENDHGWLQMSTEVRDILTSTNMNLNA